jgi:hypothetical protein
MMPAALQCGGWVITSGTPTRVPSLSCRQGLMPEGNSYLDLDTEDYLHTTPQTNQLSKDIVHSVLSTSNPTNTEYLSISHDIHEQTVHNFTSYFLSQMVTYGFKGMFSSVLPCSIG